MHPPQLKPCTVCCTIYYVYLYFCVFSDAVSWSKCKVSSATLHDWHLCKVIGIVQGTCSTPLIDRTSLKFSVAWCRTCMQIAPVGMSGGWAHRAWFPLTIISIGDNIKGWWSTHVQSWPLTISIIGVVACIQLSANVSVRWSWVWVQWMIVVKAILTHWYDVSN